MGKQSKEYNDMVKKLYERMKEVSGFPDHTLIALSLEVMEFYRVNKRDINSALLDYDASDWVSDVPYRG